MQWYHEVTVLLLLLEEAPYNTGWNFDNSLKIDTFPIKIMTLATNASAISIHGFSELQMR